MGGIGTVYTCDEKCCKHCDSKEVVKSGVLRKKQRYKCKVCNKYYQEHAIPLSCNYEKRKWLIKFYLEGLSIRSISRLLKISHTSVIRWIKNYCSRLKLKTPLHSEAIEIDELYLYIGKKKKKRWLWTALCRKSKRILAYEVGGRNRATVRKLYEKIIPIRCTNYYTDSYKGYLTVFPKEKHSRKYRATNTIEGMHSAYRHYLARFRRRSKCYSKSENMVIASMELLREKYNTDYKLKGAA